MKTIELPHKVLDYACPINGLEDLYEWKTGNRLPGYCLMDISTIGFTYIKQKLAPSPRMIFWGSGMGKPIFRFLSDIVGFEFTCVEDVAFSTAWKTALGHLSAGTPVLLGLLDMYHLPWYPKFYHKLHIPQHFELMVGYDEAKNTALVQDNGLPGIQSLPLEDLKSAWNIRVPGQGKPHTFYTFEFCDQPAALEEIWHRALKKRAFENLTPRIGFMGIQGLHKAQKEIGKWREELTHEHYMESLKSLATFTCSVVPNLPQELLPFPLGYDDPHQACRDRFAVELAEAGAEYHEPLWVEASELFRQSGTYIEKVTELTVEAINGKESAMNLMPGLLQEIARLETGAWQIFL